MDNNMYQGNPFGNRKLLRARIAAGNMDKQFRRYTKALSANLKRGARDYYSTVRAAGENPLKVTQESLKVGLNFLEALGQSTAKARSLAWVVALHALPPDYQAEIGADGIPPAQRGSARSVSPADGEYPVLEAAIDALMAQAVRPPTSDCDEHIQRSASNLRRARTRALVVAKRLHEAGLADKNITLEALLSTTMTEKYIRLAYKLSPPAEEAGHASGDANDEDDEDGDEDGDDGRGPVLAFRLLDDLTALILLATLRHGAKSKQAKYLRTQRKPHKHAPLSDEAITEITKFTQPTQLRKILDLQDTWMARAESAKHGKSRVHWANLAAAVAIARTTLSRPGDLAAMRIDGSGEPVIRTRRAETVGGFKVPGDVRKIIQRRKAVRHLMDGEESWLFPGEGGPQLESSVSTSFAKATAEAGLEGLTLQRMRDVGAVILLRDDPDGFRRIATMLDYTEVRTVERRFRAMQGPTGTKKKKT
jgi:hypothetical protein